MAIRRHWNPIADNGERAARCSAKSLPVCRVWTESALRGMSQPASMSTGRRSQGRDQSDSDGALYGKPSANAPRRQPFRVDKVVIGHLPLHADDTVVDLGCGSGFTLAAAVERKHGVRLVGIDRDADALITAARLLATSQASHQLVQHDLAQPLPLADDSVNHIVCHNVLEQLADPTTLLAEAHRVLRPGGVSVWSHTDFDSVVVAGADVELTRRIIHAFADLADADMEHADGQMGRKLVQLVHHSPLRLVGIDSCSLLSAELEGPARMRIDATARALTHAAMIGASAVSVDEVLNWTAGVEQAHAENRFFYAHTTYIAIGEKP